MSHAKAPDQAPPSREEDLHPIGFERMPENRVRNGIGQRSDSCKSGVRVQGRLMLGPAHLELRLRPVAPPIGRERPSLRVIFATEEASSGAKRPPYGSNEAKVAKVEGTKKGKVTTEAFFTLSLGPRVVRHKARCVSHLYIHVTNGSFRAIGIVGGL